MLKLLKKKSLLLSLVILISFTPIFQSCNDEPVDAEILADTDGDGVPNNTDNCVLVANPDQLDTDNDGIGDACDDSTDLDTDGDGIPDSTDNCIDVANPDQADTDNDGIGDVCDDTTNPDTDGDGIPDNLDNCIDIANPDQADDDNDGIGNVCDDVTDMPLFECIDGMAGEYPCDGYDLMSHIPISVLANTMGNPEGSDIWGWTDTATGKEYALFGTTNSTAFIDVTNPINPIFLGRIDTQTSTSFWRDVKVYNNHAFIVADNVGAHGMQVFDLTRLRDITNPPIALTPDAVYSEFGSAHNIVINEDSGYAYPVGTSRSGTYQGGPLFVNIQNPTNPVGEGGFNGYAHDAQVVTYNGPDSDYTGREILIGSNENEVVIADVTDKSNPITIATIDYNNIGYTHQGWFTEDKKYFILGDETDEQGFGNNTRTIVFDFTDLDNPAFHVDYFGPSAAIDHNGYVKGNTYFQASYTAGLRLIDITNIASGTMTEVGYFDTHPENNNTSFNGAWSVYPYFTSGNILISDIERGLLIVRKSE